MGPHPRPDHLPWDGALAPPPPRYPTEAGCDPPLEGGLLHAHNTHGLGIHECEMPTRTLGAQDAKHLKIDVSFFFTNATELVAHGVKHLYDVQCAPICTSPFGWVYNPHFGRSWP